MDAFVEKVSEAEELKKQIDSLSAENDLLKPFKNRYEKLVAEKGDLSDDLEMQSIFFNNHLAKLSD